MRIKFLTIDLHFLKYVKGFISWNFGTISKKQKIIIRVKNYDSVVQNYTHLFDSKKYNYIIVSHVDMNK